MLNCRHFSKVVSADDKEPHPKYSTNDVINAKAFVRHLADAGQERRAGAQDGHEARDDNSFSSIGVEERLSALKMVFVEKPDIFIAKNFWCERPADVVIDDITQNSS